MSEGGLSPDDTPRAHAAPVTQGAIRTLAGSSIQGGNITVSATNYQFPNVTSVPPHAIARAVPVASPQNERIEHPSQTYSRLLLATGRGFPLWDPRPPNRLPAEYKAEGVRIGDVGIVHTDGYFDFLFNIRYKKDNPINRGAPEDFVPIELTDTEQITNMEISEDCIYIAEGSLQVLDTNHSQKEYRFQSNSREGALLILPEHVEKQDLVSVKRFRQYAGQCAISWYRFVNDELGRDAPNGSLYLITGWEKTSAWGTASFKPHEHEFLLSFLGERWGEVGLARHKAGKSDGDNQCIFLKGFKMTVAETFWEEILGTVRVEDVSRTGVADLMKGSTSRPFSNPPGMEMLGILMSRLSKSFNVSKRNQSSAEDNVHVSPIVDVQDTEDIHPSNLINEYLLREAPEARVAITHDNEWISLLDMKRHSPSAGILGMGLEMVSEEGIIYLQNKNQSRLSTSQERGDSSSGRLSTIGLASDDRDSRVKTTKMLSPLKTSEFAPYQQGRLNDNHTPKGSAPSTWWGRSFAGEDEESVGEEMSPDDISYHPRARKKPATNESKEREHGSNSKEGSAWTRTRYRVATATASIMNPTGAVAHEFLDLGYELHELEPTPQLQPAAELLLKLWNALESVDDNRQACLRLVEICAEILLSIREDIHEVGGDTIGKELENPLQKLTDAFLQIQELLASLTRRPFLKRYLERDEIQIEIELSKKSINFAIQLFSNGIQTRILRSLLQAFSGEDVNIPMAKAKPSDSLGDTTLNITTAIIAPTQDDLSILPSLLHSAMLSATRTDSHDLTTLLRRTLATGRDERLVRMLQVSRDEMPEAIVALIRERERWEDRWREEEDGIKKKREQVGEMKRVQGVTDGGVRTSTPLLSRTLSAASRLSSRSSGGRGRLKTNTTNESTPSLGRANLRPSWPWKPTDQPDTTFFPSSQAGRRLSDSSSFRSRDWMSLDTGSATFSIQREVEKTMRREVEGEEMATLHREFIEGAIDSLRRLSRQPEDVRQEESQKHKKGNRSSGNLRRGRGGARNTERRQAIAHDVDGAGVAGLPSWTVTRYDIDRQKKIGIGFFSDVYKGVWRPPYSMTSSMHTALASAIQSSPRASSPSSVAPSTSTSPKRALVVAIKVLSPTTPRPLFLREAKIWKSLPPHPNVLELYGASSTTSDPPWFFVCPYLKEGNLREYLCRLSDVNLTSLDCRQPGGSPSKEVDLHQFMLDIATGMAHLHHHKIYHGDLKAANILVDDQLRCVISDFGQSEMKSQVYRLSGAAPHGTLSWQAPELMLGNQLALTPEMDVYAYAICCVEILSMGRRPWPLLDDDAVRNLVLNDLRPSLPNNDFVTVELRTLLSQSWHRKPVERPTFAKIIEDMTIIRKAFRNQIKSRSSVTAEISDLSASGILTDDHSYHTAGFNFLSPSINAEPGKLALGESTGTPDLQIPVPVFYAPRPLSIRTSTSSSIAYDFSPSIHHSESIHLSRSVSPSPRDDRAIMTQDERRYRLLLNHEYHPSLTLPLWDPSPVELGVVGYLSKPQGAFITLFNAFHPERSLERLTRQLPSLRGYGKVSKNSVRTDKRNPAQRGLDTMTGWLTSRTRDHGGVQKVSRRQAFDLRAGRKAAFLHAETTVYRYIEQLEVPKKWFKANVDAILQIYEPAHNIQREDIILVTGTLDTPAYGLFVSHYHPDSQVNFNVYSNPRVGQPWGTWSTDRKAPPKLGEPAYTESIDQVSLESSKVSNAGDPWNTVLLARLRFKPDVVDPTSL